MKKVKPSNNYNENMDKYLNIPILDTLKLMAY